MKQQQYRQGAAGALLDEYERALADLETCIVNITGQELVTIVDTNTPDANCVSVQSVLTHVVSSAYSYAVYIGRSRGLAVMRPERKSRITAAGYIDDLKAAFIFTEAIFKTIPDTALEQGTESLKIRTTWEQSYDIEQLMEHAIVHILRHRRQLEKFKLILAGLAD